MYACLCVHIAVWTMYIFCNPLIITLSPVHNHPFVFILVSCLFVFTFSLIFDFLLHTLEDTEELRLNWNIEKIPTPSLKHIDYYAFSPNIVNCILGSTVWVGFTFIRPLRRLCEGVAAEKLSGERFSCVILQALNPFWVRKLLPQLRSEARTLHLLYFPPFFCTLPVRCRRFCQNGVSSYANVV